MRAQVPTFGAITPAGVATAPVAGAGVEQYNSFNGYLGISVPLHHIGGRGEAGFDLVWNAQPGWLAAYNGTPGVNAFVAIDPFPSNNIAGASSNAFGLGGPGAVYLRTGFSWKPCSGGGYAYATTITAVIFVTANGSHVSLVDAATNGAAVAVPFNSCTGGGSASWDAGRGKVFQTVDSSQIRFTSDSNVLEQRDNGHGYGLTTATGNLQFSNGVTYRVVNSQITQIEDRNGNLITLNYGGPSTSIDWYLNIAALTSVTDSLNRVTTINYSDTSCSGCLSISYPGAGNATHVVQVITDSLSNNLRSGFSLMGINALFPTSGQPSSNYNPTVAKTIKLADGNTYTLQYNSWGEVAHIVLPTSGVLEYDYVDGNGGSNNGYESGNGGVMIYRRLQTRREYAFGGTAVTSTTKHVVTTASGLTTDTVSVSDGSGTTLSQTAHVFNGSPMDAVNLIGTGCNAWNEGLETETDFGTGPAIKVKNDWKAQTGCMNNPQLSDRKTTLTDTGQVSEVDYQYDSYGNVTDEKDLDWGQSTVLRELQTGYLYQTTGAYATTANLVHLPYYVYTMDGSGNMLTQVNWRYDETAAVDAPGIARHDASYGTGYAWRGNVTSQYGWLGTGVYPLTMGAQYDIAGNMVMQRNQDGTVGTYSYNDDGQNLYAFPTTAADGLGNKTKARYDYSAGKIVSGTDANNNTTAYAYNDGLDRVTRVTEPTGAQTNFVYPGEAWTIQYHDQTTAGDEAINTQDLGDGFGRPRERRVFLDGNDLIDTLVAYDAAGRIQVSCNPTKIVVSTWTGDGLAYQTTYGYDTLGRLTAAVTPDGAVTTTSYSGSTTTVTDAVGNKRASTVDALGRVVKVVEDAGGSKLTTLYAYDALGDLTSVTKCPATGCAEGAGQQRTFVYDAMGRLVQANNPESGRTSYLYASGGSNHLMVQGKQDARGNWTSYFYDGDQRVSTVAYDDGTPATTLSRDAAGNVTQISNANAVNLVSYDGDGRVTSSTVTTQGQKYSFSYSYDLAGDLLQETYPSGRVMKMSYDLAMRATSLSGVAGGVTTPYVQSVSYFPQGTVNFTQYGNNVWPVMSYTKELQNLNAYSTLNNSPNSWLFSESYSWNGNGTLAALSEGYGNAVTYSAMTFFTRYFSYDSLNRATKVSDDGYSRNYQYDEYGNMWVSGYTGISASGLAPTSAGSFNQANNRLNAATYGDLRGNVTALGAESMVYDGESRLTQTKDTGTGQTINYQYDGLGQRVVKQVSGGATTVYVHDAFGNLAAEYNSAGVSPACVTCYLSYDYLGNVRLVTDQNAAVVARHDYIPYGEEVPNGVAGRSGNFGVTANVAQSFTGQEADGGTAGLDYFNARHLSTVTGRFLQVDPANAGADLMNPQSWNGYAYALGNPLGNVDPSGMEAVAPVLSDPCEVDASSDDPCGYQSVGGIGISVPIWGDGGGSGGGGGGAPAPAPPSGSSVGALPPGSFPGGEALGLPPGMSVPNPLSAQVLLNLWGWDCAGGICVPGADNFQIGMTNAAMQSEIQIDFANLALLARIISLFSSTMNNAAHAAPQKANSGVCAIYGNQPYMGAGLRCVCSTAGDSIWSQDTRGCLAADQKLGVPEWLGHGTCYAGSTLKTQSFPIRSLLNSYRTCKNW